MYHQAYASGVSPPGPGKISFNMRRISLSRLISTAFIVSRSCSTVRGPMIGAVKTGFASTHAKATFASFSPSSLHKSENFSSCKRCFSIKSALLLYEFRHCFSMPSRQEALLQGDSTPLLLNQDPVQPAALPFQLFVLINYTYAVQ